MSNLHEYHYSFDDGQKAGDQILELIATIEPKLRAACEVDLPADQLEAFWSEFEERGKNREPIPCVKGLFSRLIKPTGLNSDLLTLWGAEQFWENQTNYAPACEIHPGTGIIQFGSWSGHSDGDAWIIDTEYAQLRSLTLGLADFDLETVRSECYLNFFSPWQWSSFLYCEAWERDWIEPLMSR